MASLTSILPRPKREFTTQQHDPLLAFGAEAQTTTTPTKKAVGPPPYGQRKGWIPRTPEDFGDGGAFPECHVAQYPLDMGNKEKQSSRALTLVTNAQGEVEYDAIAKYGQREGKIVYSKYTDLIEKRDIKDSDLAKPTPEQEEETARKTKEALEKIVNVKISSTHIASAAKQEVAAPTYVRYTSQQSAQSGADSRILRIVEMPKDPLEPPKFGHKKAPRGPPSPPAPVMHSPPRKLTVKDMANWKIPPCISNWKNAKGYTIPLDKRLAADGRGLQQVQINDGFAKLTEALYIAERTAREEVEHRAQIRKKVALKQKEERDEELRMLAQKARLTRQGGTISATPSAAGGADRGEARGAESPAATERPSRRAASPDEEEIETPEEREARLRRDKLRAERAKEIEYEMKKAARKQSSKTRDEDRDVTEKIALGQAAGPRSTESLFDTRLFNQTSGMDSGFGDDDTYAVYDKPLFKGSQTSQIYRPTKQAYDPYAGMGEEEASEGLKNKFRPNKDFSGVDRSAPSAPRTEPVQFEKQDDPFGLGEILGGSSSASAAGEDSTDARKRPLDKIGRGGFMSASAGGGAARDEDQLSYRDSKRSRIDFKSAGDFKAEDSRDKDDRDRDYDRRDRDDRDRDRDYDRRDRDRDRDYDRRRGGDRDRDRDYRDDRRGRDDDRRRR